MSVSLHLSLQTANLVVIGAITSIHGCLTRHKISLTLAGVTVFGHMLAVALRLPSDSVLSSYLILSSLQLAGFHKQISLPPQPHFPPTGLTACLGTCIS